MTAVSSRFGCKGKSQVKLRTNVVFSTGKLDLSPFLSSSVNSGAYSSYSLYAVVVSDSDFFVQLVYNL